MTGIWQRNPAQRFTGKFGDFHRRMNWGKLDGEAHKLLSLSIQYIQPTQEG
jgi:hypothetical protein